MFLTIELQTRINMGQMDLDPIEKLIGERKFDKAEKYISTLSDQNIANYLKSRILVLQGEHEKALKLLGSIIQDENDTTFDYFYNTLSLKATSLHSIGEYHKSHDLIEVLRNNTDFLNDYIALLSIDMGNYLFLGDFQKVVKMGMEALRLQQVADNQSEKMKILKNIGTSYFQMGRYPEARNYFDQALDINKSLKNTREFAILYNNIGLVNYSEGNLDTSLEMYELAVQEFRKIGAENHIAVVLSNISLIYQGKNQFNKALEHMKESLRIQEKLGNRYYISICQTNLARIYIDQGNLHQANQLLLKSRAINEELNHDYLLAESYTEYGQLLFRRGDIELSREYLSKAMVLREKIGDKNMTSYTLYIAIKNEINFDFEKAKIYFSQLEEIATNFDNKYVQVRQKLAKALMLQHSNRLTHQTQAQMIYEELLSQEQLHYDFTLDIIQNLFELLIQEIFITKELSLINNLEELSRNVAKLAQEQNSKPLEVKSLVLNSKIEFLKGNMNQAKTQIHQAMEIAEDNDLHTLNILVTLEYNQLVENIDKVHSLQKLKGTDTLDNEEMIRSINTFGNILSNRIDFDQIQRNEIPKLFFIAVNGTFVYDYEFGKMNQLTIRNEILGQGNELFLSKSNQKQSFELMKVEQYFLIISFVNEIMIGFAYEGQSYSTIHKFNTILDILRSSSDFKEFLSRESPHFTISMKEEMNILLKNSFEEENESKIVDDENNATETAEDTEPIQVVKPLPILKNYEILLHPIRLTIIKLLASHYSLLRSHLLKLTGLNSGTLQTHLDTLEKMGWISKEIEFVDNRPRSILYIEPIGTKTYHEFATIFKEYILET